ncbi:hypothetical protein B0A48_06748 [Cryoendolithus antarcticus]|uniref:Uncharacterized protein n=1 Tax=Cryoendolithus antarcticus TaxID=1507870 RepID=A0A1V8T976_9PEZI|nr:hypothetical protein B0A48_06748 [Cryoendolithus antarcticus]
MNYEAALSIQQHQQTALFGNGSGIATIFPTPHTDDMLAGMQKVQGHGEDTIDSASHSGSSDLNAVDNNETDTLGQAIMQHQRDAIRLRQALDADARPLLETRLRPRPRISELIEREEREEALAAAAASNGVAHTRGASTGSSGSEPPLNVPREWGTRAKSQRGWMRRIREPSVVSVQLSPTLAQGEGQKQDEDAIVPRRTALTGDEYWSPPRRDNAFAKDMTPPSMNRQRPASQPNALRPANSTLQDTLDSEDPDLEGLSLLQSTPALPRLDRTATEYMRREIETVERQGVTRRHLGQLAERPNGSIRHRASQDDEAGLTNGHASHNRQARPVTTPSDSKKSRITRRRSLISNQENVPVNGGSSTTYKGIETVTITDRTAQAVTFKQPQRPGHTRQDSMKLLQRLARVSSLSPSPAKASPEAVGRGYSNVHSTGQVERPKSEPYVGGHEDARIAQDAGREQEAEHDVGRPNSESSHDARARSRSSRSSVRLDAYTAQQEDDAEEKQHAGAPVSTASARDAQEEARATAGANGETQALRPSTDVRPLLRTSDTTIIRAFGTPSGEALLGGSGDMLAAEYVRQVSGGSRRPTSALDDIVREAQEHPGELFGDATIQSLEDIAHPNMDATDTTATVDFGDAEEDRGLARPLTQTENDRRQEDLAMKAMNKHLRAARTSIKDADRGLRRVEHRAEEIANSPVKKTTTTSTTILETAPTTSTQSTHTGPCPHCDLRYRSLWHALFSEFLSAFYAPSRTSRLGVRLTSLGKVLAFAALCYILESLLCWKYCHPFYARRMEGYGVWNDAPRSPFVIPTLLFRPLRPIWRPTLNWAREAIEVAYHHVLGIEQKVLPVPRFMEPGFKLTPEMMRSDLRPGMFRSSYPPASAVSGGFGKTAATAGAGAVAGRWGGWVGTSVVSKAVETGWRAVGSARQAVDEVGGMWEDEWLE